MPVKTNPVQEKPYKLVFERRKGYLRVQLTGQRGTYQLSRGAWAEIAEHCKKHGFTKVLLEKDLRKDISIIEMLELISALPELGLGSTIVAIVDRNSQRNELNEFGETAASNRGLQHRFFPDADKAEKWLLGG